MEIKYKKNIGDYKYLVMFDLASKITGVCLWDIEHMIPLRTNVIKVGGKTELNVAELYKLIDEYFHGLFSSGIALSEVVVGKEAMPTQLRGGSSTVQTFLALSKSHAILDWYLYSHDIAVYDYIGVYPISTHAFLKKLNGWDNSHPVEKTDIKEYVSSEYGMIGLSLDESDSVFLAKTLIEVKWDRDICEKIKEIKKHRNSLKSEHAMKTCDDEIDRLNNLKRK